MHIWIYTPETVLYVHIGLYSAILAQFFIQFSSFINSRVTGINVAVSM